MITFSLASHSIEVKKMRVFYCLLLLPNYLIDPKGFKVSNKEIQKGTSTMTEQII